VKYLYLILSTIFGLIGGITLILSIIEFFRDGFAGLYLLLFSILYLGIKGVFTWLFIRRIKKTSLPSLASMQI